MIDQGKHNVVGINVDAVDYDGAIQRIVTAAANSQPMAVSALAVHGVMTGALDPTHRYRLNSFEMVVPDGQPVRWALSWLHGVRVSDRVYGPTLMLKTCQRAAQEGLPIFLFGGSEQLLDALETRLRSRFPNLQIAGKRASMFRRLTEAERDEVVAEIRGSGAAITFVGLGCPRQEIFAFEFRERLSMPLLAVGAAFNFHAGALPQAPSFMQKRGLEWLYRLAKEPRRLWRRYLILNPYYLSLLFLQKTGLSRFNPNSAVPPTQEWLYG